MKYPKLRIAWSAGWGMLGVLICVLWARSYPNNGEQCWGHFPNGDSFEVDSTQGYVWAGIYDGNYSAPFTYKRIKLSGDTLERVRSQPMFQFMEPVNTQCICVLKMPYWFLILFPFLTAALPWPSYRFSLRTLLIAITLIALVLGLIAWAAR